MYFSVWVSVGPDVHQSGIPLCPQHWVGPALVFGSLWLLGRGGYLVDSGLAQMCVTLFHLGLPQMFA